MVSRIIVALKKLGCRKAGNSHESFIDTGKRSAAPSAVSSSTSFSAPEDDIERRVRDTKSMASFMDGVDRAYGRLHGGYESVVPPPMACVKTKSYSDEMEPVSFISMDPTLYEEGYRWPVYTNQDFNISAVTMDLSLQRSSTQAPKSDILEAREQIMKDSPGFRRGRETVDETHPIARVTESLTEERSAGLRLENRLRIQEMVHFSDEDSMNYSRFPNSFISIAETSVGTWNIRDPSCSSLSHAAELKYYEI